MYDGDPHDEYGQPPNRFSMLLLWSGAILLVAAGTVIYLRGGNTEPPGPKQFRVEQPDDIPGPLVADTDHRRPIAPLEKDAAAREGRASSVGDNTPTEEGPRGTIDPAQVNGFINERFVFLKACYERRLKLNPMLEGKMDLNIGISETGRVLSVRKAQDTVNDPEMWRCVRKTIRSWRFPKPSGGQVQVAKVFNFKKRH